MAPRTSWSGAVEVNAFPVHLCLYNRVKSTKGKSLRMVTAKGQPLSQQMVDPKGKAVPSDKIKSGIELGPDQFHVLSDEALEQIKEAQRSVTVEPEQFCPLDSIPFDLATSRYTVTADEKVPGSKRSADGLWNGLKYRNIAYVTRITMRAGGRDSILVLYPDDEGLLAATIPFESELNEAPRGDFTEDGSAGETFDAFLTATGVKVAPFDHGALKSEYSERRAKVLADATAGKTIEPPKAPEPTESTADLMAALEQGIKDAKKKPARKPARKKAAAKA